MQRTTISMPDELAEALAHEARRLNVSVSLVAREALMARLGLVGPKPQLGFVGLGHSGRADTSRRVDEILAEDWHR